MCKIMLCLLTLWCTVSAMSVFKSGSRFKSDAKVNCTPIPEEVLSEILGASYNSRYMSINKPQIHAPTDNNSGKRQTDPSEPSFYVDDDYQRELGPEPAWNLKSLTLVQRSKRATKYKTLEKREPWQCEKRIQWLDLGPDYFPRYLRSVECTKHTCFYGHYRCKPRSFTLRLMRRKAGLCAQLEPDKKIGVAGLPLQLRELWVWEERAVNFCCECAAG
ncbi:protein trunk [Ctenocephalides felis]|uniref:protein trunk n=1 Tax=Ctenocephalides felis TaxID=7515 RepID=UPI000E6E2129|nr:protein trunk [Ctenocephalides felis]